MNLRTTLPPLRKQFAKVKEEAHGAYRKNYFDRMTPGMLEPDMIKDTAKIVNDAQKDKVQVNLIINNRAGGNAPLIVQTIADRLHSKKPQRLFLASQLK